MSELLEKIRSRGYWKVIIRPSTFVEHRVAHRSSLLPILEKTSVDFKGWRFPHIDSFRDPDKGADWIGQEIDWIPCVELWRFYQSGQFVFYSGMLSDWTKHTGTYTGWSSQWPYPDDGKHYVLLDIKEVIVGFTEIFEFAARLAFTEAGDDQIHLEVEVNGIRNHLLRFVPSNQPGFFHRMEDTGSELPYISDLSRLELVANTRDIALKPAIELFRRFKWDPGIEVLRDIQSELLSRRTARIR